MFFLSGSPNCSDCRHSYTADPTGSKAKVYKWQSSPIGLVCFREGGELAKGGGGTGRTVVVVGGLVKSLHCNPKETLENERKRPSYNT